MKRVFLVVITLAGLALAQPPQTPPAANPPAGRGGPGRGGFAPVVIGPPAPVPPEVAIPRPTPSELAEVNDALAQWIDADKSPAKPLLQKFESLLMLQTAASECRGNLHANPVARWDLVT